MPVRLLQCRTLSLLRTAPPPPRATGINEMQLLAAFRKLKAAFRHPIVRYAEEISE